MEPEREDAKPTRTIVTSIFAALLPDVAALDTPPVCFVSANGEKAVLHLRQVYNSCLSLFKASAGCVHCPDRGSVCLSLSAGLQGVLPLHLDVVSARDVLDQITNGDAPVIAGHVFVWPGDTRLHRFMKTLRPYWEHDFTLMAENKRTGTDAALKAARTKEFKRSECSRCVISNSCAQASWCSGAYPPEDVIVSQSCARLDEAFSKSSWPTWQLWEVARFMGATAKHSRWNIVLTGLSRRGSDIVGTVHRSKGHIALYPGLKTYEEIAEVFGLAATEEEALAAERGPITDSKIRALLWLTLNSRARQTYGWGCVRHNIGIGVSSWGVRVQWANNSRLMFESTVSELSHIASKLSYGRIGDVQRTVVR